MTEPKSKVFYVDTGDMTKEEIQQHIIEQLAKKKKEEK